MAGFGKPSTVYVPSVRADGAVVEGGMRPTPLYDPEDLPARLLTKDEAVKLSGTKSPSE